ncbi:hypothetical protein [Salinigranum salinum]|uniref:hypothetical protein n=1 Tax=Salinigranum salinum TaxID=1364937 RepID=UPI001260F4DB|nr:hypothetical protein [Salinigranum salinum]
MRRRRLLVATLAAVSGCTSAGYRATGPRTPPPRPETDAAPASTPDPVEARAQAILRPLNEVYRTVRGPLADFEVADVSDEQLAAARDSLARAREAQSTFSSTVADPPARYQSLPTLVATHGSLLDALVAAVDCWSSLSSIVPVAPARADDTDSAARLTTARTAVQTLTTVATDLADAADAEPTIPPALFLTTDRVRSFATTLDTQSTALERLIEAVAAVRDAADRWRDGVTALERQRYDDARAAFSTAREEYRAASESLDAGPDPTGSFVDLAESTACVVSAGVEAASTAVDATELASAGDVARAETRLDEAETIRNRCVN